MSSFNKIITNMPVSLNETEISNLSNTLSGIIQGGGGGETRRYVGDGVYVTINNDVNPALVTLTQTSIEKLDRDIPTKVSELTDSASYQTTAGMSGYLTTGDAANTYQPKGDYLSANALDNISGTWENVTAKLDTTAFSTVSSNFLTAHQSLSSYYQKTETSGADQLAAAFGDILNYDVTAAAGIEITTATDNGTTTFGISMTAQPVVTDTNLSGYNGIAAAPDGTKSGWWNVGLTQDMINTINGKLDSSVAGETYQTIADMQNYQPVSSMGEYQKTAGMLNYLTTAQYETDSAKFLTAHQSLSSYYQKSETSGANELATEFAKYVTSGDITTQDTDYVMTTNGWKVLTLPGGGMTQVIHDATLTGQGNDANSKLGVAWSALSGNTIASALSAGWAVSAKGANSEYKIGTWLDALSEFRTDIITWSEEITGSSGIEVSLNEYYYPVNFHLTETAYNAIKSVSSKVDKPTSLVNKYLVLRTDDAGNVSGWTDFNANVYSKSESDGRYQKKTDMSSYLTTTQYETDSATFVTSSSNTISGTKQYALTTAGWAEVQAGSTFTGVETTGAISGTGLAGSEIGLVKSATSALDLISDQYQIDGSQYITVVPNTATKKVVIGLDNQVSNAIDTVTANANIWNNASAVSAKSNTTIDNTTNIITTENQGTSASLSAVEYKDNVNVAGMNVQQIYAVRSDGDIFACLSTTANKGTLFFVCSGV